MPNTGTEKENSCAHCHKPLFGRTDKRFCNDTCRNTFNRQKTENQKLQASANLPEIFRIIKRNYEILKENCPQVLDHDENMLVNAKEFLKTGFSPKFFTSVHITSYGEIWYCCFELGFRIGEDYAFIRHFPEQAIV
ncbi:putative nucleic acid-binding Zn ribbon protein [Mucilaginibacter dorajii]|uniref:DUF2116 family Zn-ribbon domain-containing protein n=1 Tax=Mucilaginibacter dorajii TaxID=692994 RepID=A0ABP7Q5K4_9SPHI|nr:putative nucleic acid-binding Zn ribbon protein [Mucilaginibacter dorajii]